MAKAIGSSFECKNCGRPVVWAKTDSGSTFLANPKDKYAGKTWLDPHSPEQCRHEANMLNDTLAQIRKQRIEEQLSVHPEVLSSQNKLIEAGRSGDLSAVEAAANSHQEVLDKVREQLTAAQEQASATTPTEGQKKPKGFANKFPGKCVDCGNFVQKGEGLTSKPADKWELRCVTCHHG